MQARALLLATPLSMSSLRKKSSPITLKSPACTSTKLHNVVVASNATVTAPKREKDPKKVSLSQFDASNCPVRFGGEIHGFKSDGYIDEKKYDKRLDDCQRYCIVAGNRALEDAALGVQEHSMVALILLVWFVDSGRLAA
ncbi:3-oxoacyl-[acyl-carrier-protein] synthase 2 [Tanacetum coccineum]|uniref:3-oxoacyl-[acyl-carrier-protein] synthase 2 n=1 Tax=Tanacetum coccineum TaxID=301880 RepID=A0ABQ5C9K6_9ASTR